MSVMNFTTQINKDFNTWKKNLFNLQYCKDWCQTTIIEITISFTHTYRIIVEKVIF